MKTVLSVVTSLSCALATVHLYGLSGMDSHSLMFLGGWAVAPYPAHCVLAFAARRRPEASVAILVGTIASGGVAILLFLNDLQPWIDARSRGVEPPMNCGGPLVEFGLPVVQWIFLGVLGWVAMTSRPADQSQPGEIVHELDR